MPARTNVTCMNVACRAGAILLTAMLAACGGEEAAAPSSAPPPVALWSATEQWRVDGSGGDGTAFGDLRDFVVTPQGVLWALDFREQRIRRYGPDGSPLPSVSRRGSGPGEIGAANGLLVVGDGSVWLNDPPNGRLSVFDSSGRYVRQVRLPIGDRWLRWDAWIDAATGHVMDPYAERATGTQASVRRWRRLALDGSVQDTVAIPSCDPSPTPVFRYYSGRSADGQMTTWDYYPFTAGGGTAPDGRGGLWCALATSSQVARLRIGSSDTIALTTPALGPVPVSEAERRLAIAEVESSLANFPTNTFDPAQIPDAKPPIAQVSVDDDGRVWVQRSVLPGPARVTFDVHDSTGRRIAELTLPGRPAPHWLAVRARGDDVWLALLDDDDVPWIVRYRVTPSVR